MALKEQDVVLYSTDTDGNKVIQMPITRIENVEGAIKTIDGVAPDENGNVATGDKVTSINGMTGSVTIKEGGSNAYQIPYATCSSSSSTAVATVINDVPFKLVRGAIVFVEFTDAQYEGFSLDYLNVDSTGAKKINGFTKLGISFDRDGGTGVNFIHNYTFVYDGSYWNLIGPFNYYEGYDGGAD